MSHSRRNPSSTISTLKTPQSEPPTPSYRVPHDLTNYDHLYDNHDTGPSLVIYPNRGASAGSQSRSTLHDLDNIFEMEERGTFPIQSNGSIIIGSMGNISDSTALISKEEINYDMDDIKFMHMTPVTINSDHKQRSYGDDHQLPVPIERARSINNPFSKAYRNPPQISRNMRQTSLQKSQSFGSSFQPRATSISTIITSSINHSGIVPPNMYTQKHSNHVHGQRKDHVLNQHSPKQSSSNHGNPFRKTADQPWGTVIDRNIHSPQNGMSPVDLSQLYPWDKLERPQSNGNMSVDTDYTITTTVPRVMSTGTVISSNVNQDDLEEELDDLRAELQAIKNREYEPKQMDQDDDISDVHAMGIKRSGTISKRYSNLIQDQHNIYNAEYPKDAKKQMLVTPFRKCIFQWLGGICCWIFILIVGGAIIASGIYTIFAGIFRREYGQSFNNEGQCRIVSVDDGISCKNHCYDYTFKIHSLSPCNGVKDYDTYTISLENDSTDYGDTGEIISCYTNNNCDEIFMEKGDNRFIDEAAWIFIGAGAIFVAAWCCTGGMVVIWWKRIGVCQHSTCFQCCNVFRQCMEYYGGVDKSSYHLECWEENMMFDEKLDYFVGFMKRKHGFRISNKIIQLIINYNDYKINDNDKDNQDIRSNGSTSNGENDRDEEDGLHDWHGMIIDADQSCNRFIPIKPNMGINLKTNSFTTAINGHHRNQLSMQYRTRDHPTFI